MVKALALQSPIIYTREEGEDGLVLHVALNFYTQVTGACADINHPACTQKKKGEKRKRRMRRKGRRKVWYQKLTSIFLSVSLLCKFLKVYLA